MDWLLHLLLALACLIALAGAVLPMIPAIPLIFALALVHRIFLPDVLSWWTVGVIGVCILVSFGIDFLGTAMGAKWGGATRYGLVGAAVGFFFGLFLGIPGMLLGPIVGAFVGELFAARQPVDRALRSGVGAGLGLAAATLLRFLLTLALVILVAVDLFFWV